jgi:hypothetical protein
MNLQRWTTWMLFVVTGIAGCAGLQPPPVPAPISPADIIKAIPQGNNTTVVNVQPTPQHQTLPDFLGITRCCNSGIACCQTVRAQAAFCFPALAGIIAPGAGIPIPPPENAPPAVAAASAIAEQEAQAQATIQALRYLANFGCGCYDKPDHKVEKAFLDALEDCNEDVRFEAVMALRKVAGGECKCEGRNCSGCNVKCCCTQKVIEKLHKLAYETDECGCPYEPSDRVRRVARITLKLCGPIAKCEPEPEPDPNKEKAPEKPAGPPPEAPPATPPATPPAGGEAAPPMDPPAPPPNNDQSNQQDQTAAAK